MALLLARRVCIVPSPSSLATAAHTARRAFSSPSRQPLARPTLRSRVLARSEDGGAAKSPISWKSLVVLCVVGGSFISYFQFKRDEIKKDKEQRQSKPIGQPVIGGPFTLIDTSGKQVTDKDFRGKWLLLYFGFTFCPDVCPEELNKITEVAKNFAAREDKKGELVPVFISVDPQRDTPAKIGEYLKDFHPSFVGLTGSDEQLRGITKAFRVYYSKPPESDNPDYLVDHSIMTYLIDPEGGFAAYYGQNVTAEAIADAIARQSRAWKPAEQRQNE